LPNSLPPEIRNKTGGAVLQRGRWSTDRFGAVLAEVQAECLNLKTGVS